MGVGYGVGCRVGTADSLADHHQKPLSFSFKFGEIWVKIGPGKGTPSRGQKTRPLSEKVD